uniref:Uncharacterized protein n=1 Tax=Siphoviridae sp. ctLNL10 TaxID=2825453 RepID=A0A8S5Q495_9CAUD|nr:MAG TPA: hypothetical protein [Siphoviridae sp. ctLNL10]
MSNDHHIRSIWFHFSLYTSLTNEAIMTFPRNYLYFYKRHYVTINQSI